MMNLRWFIDLLKIIATVLAMIILWPAVGARAVLFPDPLVQDYPYRQVKVLAGVGIAMELLALLFFVFGWVQTAIIFVVLYLLVSLARVLLFYFNGPTSFGSSFRLP